MPLPTWLFAPALVLLLPLILRLVPGEGRDERWSWSRDGALALLAGPALVALCWWLGAFHARAGYSVADFPEHCSTIAAGLAGQLDHWTRNRSLVVGWPAVVAARTAGVIDGMVLGSALGAALTGTGLYLWGRALHGRLAGVAAVLLAPAVAALAVLPRTLSFYPMITGCMTLACGLAAVAVRWRSSSVALLAGGAGIALALLTDVRGLIWALALLPAVGGVALLAHPRRWPLRLAAVVVPVWLSFGLGPQVYTEDHTSLEVQANVVRMLRERNDPAAARMRHYEPPSAFVWGRSDLRELPTTLAVLTWYREVAATRADREPGEALRLEQQVQPWLPVVSVGALVALWGLRRRPLMLLAALATCAPFVAAFQGAIGIQRAHMRFLTSSMSFVPLILGLAFATLAAGALGRPRQGRGGAPTPPRRPWRLTVATVALLLLVLGAMPSWLSPIAPWRRTLLHEDGGMVRLWSEMRAANPSPASGPCVRQLTADRDAGRPRWVTPADSQGNPL